MTNQAIPDPVPVCDSCGERTATPPVCEDCRTSEVTSLGETIDAGSGLSNREGAWLLAEVDRLRATLARRGEEYDGMRDRFGSQVGALRDHWYRDRDRALQAEADRDRLARQVKAVREFGELWARVPALAACGRDILRALDGGAS